MKPLFISVLLFFTSMGQDDPHVIPKVIMAIFAHPDDEAVTNVGSILTKYARDGHKVYLVIVTKGELGIKQHAGVSAGDSLAKVRAGEAKCACKALRIEPPILLGLGDASLATGLTQEPVHQKIDSILKQYQPDIIITWGPDGGYGHLDHRMVHSAVTDFYQSGEILKKTKLFYAGMPARVWRSWTEQKKGKVWMYNSWNAVSEEYLTTRIKVTEEDLHRATTALYCHWSQFTEGEMEETSRWMKSTEDTVFLRPFFSASEISYELIP